jgi:hypothetical protein
MKALSGLAIAGLIVLVCWYGHSVIFGGCRPSVQNGDCGSSGQTPDINDNGHIELKEPDYHAPVLIGGRP